MSTEPDPRLVKASKAVIVVVLAVAAAALISGGLWVVVATWRAIL